MMMMMMIRMRQRERNILIHPEGRELLHPSLEVLQILQI